MPDDYVSPREFGALEQQVKNLETQVTKLDEQISVLSGKLDELIGIANKGRGAWWAGMVLASLVSGFAAFFTTNFFTR